MTAGTGFGTRIEESFSPSLQFPVPGPVRRSPRKRSFFRPVFYIVFLLFVLVPLAELWLLFRLAQATDWLTTVAIVVATGILGTALARWQGLDVWRRIREQLSQGKSPTTELLDGLMILFAGAFLITPGILTDGVGLLLLMPPVRGFLRGWLVRRLMPPGAMHVYSFATSRTERTGQADGTEIEAEYTVEREKPADDTPKDPRLPDAVE